MFRRTASDRLAKRIKFLLVQEATGQKAPAESIGLRQAETAEDRFVKSVIDPRLTAEENAVLVQKMLEVREAFITMILSNRQTSHSKDFVAG